MFSCILVGETVLLTQCGDLALRRGACVTSVLSEDPLVQRWAKEKGLAWSADLQSAAREHGGVKPDYLLSIVNSTLLPPALLSLPTHGCINYHDSLLPRYAGSHAVAWALAQGEVETGVTWHLMTDEADRGDVLVQQRVPIEPGDSAATLNARCALAALTSFGGLLSQLRALSLKRRAQTGERSFYYRYRRPTPACVLDWSMRARELADWARALDFGAGFNPLGLAKVVTEHGEVARVTSLHAMALDRIGTPGTVLAHDDGGACVVQAGDGTVKLRLAPVGFGHNREPQLRPGLRLLSARELWADWTEFDARACLLERPLRRERRQGRTAGPASAPKVELARWEVNAPMPSLAAAARQFEGLERRRISAQRIGSVPSNSVRALGIYLDALPLEREPAQGPDDGPRTYMAEFEARLEATPADATAPELTTLFYGASPLPELRRHYDLAIEPLDRGYRVISTTPAWPLQSLQRWASALHGPNSDHPPLHGFRS